jgi:uncharacterized membrane protein YeaQ/YmgE (transglycosylase-associated protein family)
MNTLIVLSWVGVGAFVAWISTHLAKVPAHNAGVANLAVGVLGALIGGTAMHAVIPGRSDYAAYLAGVLAASIVSVLLIGLTRHTLRRSSDERVA